MNRIVVSAFAILLLASATATGQESAVRWWEGYNGDEANGPHVLGLWKFDGDEQTFLSDSSAHGHQATLRGAKPNRDGRFGGCLESSAGYPVVDESHGFHVTRSPVLSPTGSFTVELWIKAKPADAFPADARPVLLDMKYVPYNHTGFMLSLTPQSSSGTRQLALQLGTGSESHAWYSDPLRLPAGAWRHVAFTYDARGTVAFFLDGEETGRSTRPEAGPMAAAVRPLSIGDRIGSLYNGFPGYIDEVRITKGIRDFRPIRFVPDVDRFVFLRMTPAASLTARLVNQTGAPLRETTAVATLPDGSSQRLAIPELAAGESHAVAVRVNTSLKPGEYEATLSVELPGWGGGDAAYRSTTELPFVIVPRPLPHRMPVVMWGIGGTAGVVKEIPRLKQLGFTHCLGLRCDFQKVWEEGAEAMPASPEEIRQGRQMLNVALENDMRIVASLSPGSWLRHAEVGRPYLRVDRNGKPYGREDVSGIFSEVQDFCLHTGAAMGRAYGDHPAFAAALLHTEVRGESQLSFRPLEIEAYRRATGAEIPEEVTIKNGVQWNKLPDFPRDRVIADDDPILQYLRWFWKQGDGWNDLNTRVHEGLRQHVTDDFWTFHDPAVRVPSIGGSGGKADVLSHWTYSYPDPVRIGLCTDELLEMARVNGHDQDVMKMTQLIWYRSQTAPKDSAPPANTSPWVDQDPGAEYITIAPMHLREAFWWKIARPIQGIMYHGWQSLVETDSPGAYRYTNPNTQHELRRLIDTVVQPLGPTLTQLPDAPSDVAFLESFTSQMFARRGTYGWNHSWAGEMYHILMYAQLQPRVLYEESLLAGGLDGAKILVLADCDVLTRPVVRLIQQFQAEGGLIVGDAEVCPAIEPDFVMPRFSRTNRADEDRSRLQEAAGKLRAWLDERYSRVLDSSNPNVVTRRRVFGSTDYVFAVNDHREFGTYVGGYGRVMEDGLPSETTLRLRHSRPSSAQVYDLVAGREVAVSAGDDALAIPLQLGPCEGRLLMVTPRPITDVDVDAPQQAAVGEKVRIAVAVTDGRAPVDAIVPVQVRISDPEGIASEFSGYHAAVGGRLTIDFDFAPNDRVGVWQVRVKELASGNVRSAYIRLSSN